MKLSRVLHIFVLLLCLALSMSAFGQQKKGDPTERALPKGALPTVNRIVFLGDSITQSGQYIEFLETVILAETGRKYEVLNLGLASETVSGLSESGHADGKFPRPQLQERLGRVLEKTKPELLVVCYGMNDGIYYPYKDSRFERFTSGMQIVRDQAWNSRIAILHLTPPVFDPVPISDKVLPPGLGSYPKPFARYNAVLDRYTVWMLGKAQRVNWRVVDIHTPMNEYLEEKRKTDPAFTLAKDGIHPNAEGHWVMARPILASWGVKHDYKPEDFSEPTGRLTSLYKLVSSRQRILKAAWLSECGHKRPGVPPGLPLAEAQEKAAALAIEIDAMLTKGKLAFAGEAAITPVSVVPKGPTGSEVSKSPAAFPGERTVWHGFDRYEFVVDGFPVTVVAPKSAAPGKPWVWHGEFFGHKPDPDIALLGKGFHLAYMKVSDMLGCPKAVQHWNVLYAELTKKHGFSKKPALVGLSRGGLYCYNWAIANPEKVSCIYADAPVCDFKSWPGGKGKGKGDPTNWARVLQLWGFKDEAEALAYKGNPVDSLAPLAKRKVPLLHVFGDADDVVPWDENTGLVAERYRKMGGSIELIAKAGVGHHPHGLQDSTPIVTFIVKHASK